MLHRISTRLYAILTAALVLAAVPASAQFTPRATDDPATGEQYIIEGAAGFWRPTADMTISSEALGIVGSSINFKNDLGMTDQRFGELKAVFRPAKKHKLRFQYIPIKYSQSATLTRSITFNGQLYQIGLPVNSQLEWKAYRFTYEFDVVSRDRWFAGLLLDAKYTDVKAALQSPVVEEFAHARAPIPAIGGIARFYVVPNISITGEFSGLKIPDSISEEYKAHYADLDIYGTVNINRYIGGQIGFRTFDVGYLVEKDTGSFVLKGIYFGMVARY